MTRTARPAAAVPGPHVLRPRDRTAIETLQTVGAGAIGAGCLFYLFSAAGSFSAFGDLVDAWWLPLSIASVVASALGLIAVAASARPDLLGRAALACAAAYLLVMGTWFLAWNDRAAVLEAGSPTTAVWITMIPELASIALMVGGRPVVAVVNLVAAGALSEMVAALAVNGMLDEKFIVQAFWSVAFGGVYLLFAAAAVAFARRLDSARAATVATARHREHEDLHDVDRRRLDALVHDRIIAFLLALSPGEPEPSVRAAASGVIDELDHWWDPSAGPSESLDGREIVQRLRTMVSSLGDAVVVRGDVDHASTARFDADVTDALLDAAAEAVRNFYRHAGVGASCVVIASVSDDAITVTVADDGVGFDPAATRAGRLGLSFGVTGRMGAVAGGRSSIVSAPGEGARIRLRWDRP
ncbi:two-component sensor histidine kinase [Gordonia spumicola]|uniref:Two-component sensor histidine kinase n=1 Tax=Gordonia spumicola TaxID=589161 RepID=A0A7I9V4G3_9ACTN|nr:ATP-binding protein [Gordonia spumicola]GED99909.1 two-component sensor histidine kinase [Gordonia spumicola]